MVYCLSNPLTSTRRHLFCRCLNDWRSAKPGVRTRMAKYCNLIISRMLTNFWRHVKSWTNLVHYVAITTFKWSYLTTSGLFRTLRGKNSAKATHTSEMWMFILVETTRCNFQTGIACRKVLFNKRSTSKADARRGNTLEKSLKLKKEHKRHLYYRWRRSYLFEEFQSFVCVLSYLLHRALFVFILPFCLGE